jgi:hypothetical protein
LKRLFRHHTAVVSYLALFLAVGGSAAYAQRYMISGADIVDESVTVADLGNASVGTAEVAYGSLTDNDLGPNSVRASELDVKTFNVAASSDPGKGIVTAHCPDGATLLGGGGSVETEHGWEPFKTAVNHSAPDGNGWTVAGGPIPYPAQMQNWNHNHDVPGGDDSKLVNWESWVWKDTFRFNGKWWVTATAICAEL